MLKNTTFKILIFLSFLALLAAAFGICLYTDFRNCMNIRLLSEDRLERMIEVCDLDLSAITLNGEPIAMECANNTIYIPQSSENLGHYTQLQGRIKSNNPNQTLFLLNDASLYDLPNIVRRGETLTLIVVERNRYQRIKVVLTTLPVLRLDGNVTGQDEEQRDILAGQITMWSAASKNEGKAELLTSEIEWHLRGHSTAMVAKKSWKLSLKNQNGKNNHLDLLGLGEDDDWILNGMAMDDTKLREKLFIDIWNEMVGQNDHLYPMSACEYTEVVMNGEYQGIYLLQRRVDAKYLKLHDNDVLLKSTDLSATNAEEAYQFITPKDNASDIHSLMQRVFDGTDCSGYVLDNAIDTNLMIQFASAKDNCTLKNMYHVLRKTDMGYDMYFVPWDTDMSFGLVWKDNIGFVYDYDTAMDNLKVRKETEAIMQNHPEYKQKAADRWVALRKGVLEENALMSRIHGLYVQLRDSGAAQRDREYWGRQYDGADTIEQLKIFVLERLSVIDNLYEQG